MDTLSPEERSKRMSLVRNKDTKPELVVRRLVYQLGYRYRLHGKGLPGHPDLVFRSLGKLIFVHGCFWHRHPEPSCWRVRVPKSRQEFWRQKFEGNESRDRANIEVLERQGWNVLVVWECQTEKPEQLRRRPEITSRFERACCMEAEQTRGRLARHARPRALWLHAMPPGSESSRGRAASKAQGICASAR